MNIFRMNAYVYEYSFIPIYSKMYNEKIIKKSMKISQIIFGTLKFTEYFDVIKIFGKF